MRKDEEDWTSFKVTVQFERCFRLMEHISVISRRNPINLFITEKLIKFSKSLFNFCLVISNILRERTPRFPTFVFPFRSSKSDALRLMGQVITFSYLTLFIVQNCVSVFLKNRFVGILQPKPRNSTFVIESGEVIL